MSRYQEIDDALWQADRNIQDELGELEEALSGCRESTRYYNGQYRRERQKLRNLNNKKRRLLRQLDKVRDMQESLKPKFPAPTGGNDE